ncbi:peptidylprolyl isomerase [uncultured Pseudoteredinibacter sp.]|uniref:peptidylprolyl isomerase n=1 Tax=uncultured Pseudoteredinibacter sp. TaxID=1641701 RepID=UPI002620B981|nr:peptidylprolyl isomerase [uncultured Pseudoteredinibacter sp.]
MNFIDFLKTLLITLLVSNVSASELLNDGKVSITVKDMESYIAATIPLNSKQAAALRDPAGYAEILSNAYVTKYMANKALETGALTKEEAHQIAEVEINRILMRRYLDSLVNEQFSATDWNVAAKEYYLVNKRSYSEPRDVSVSHILIKGKSDSAEVASKISAVMEELDAGNSFKDTALKYSEDRSVSRNNGDLGFIGRGKMIPKFEKAALALTEIGQISGPIETRFGIHIIRLDKAVPARVKSLDEVKLSIIQELKVQRENKIRKGTVVQVRSNPDAKINQEVIDKYVAESLKRYAVE